MTPSIQSTRFPSLLLLLVPSILAAYLAGCGDDATNTTPAPQGPADAASEAVPDAAPEDGAAGDALPDGDAGDASPDASPDSGDAAPEPLPTGFAFVDVERGVDLTPDGRSALVWQQSTGELLVYDVATGQLASKTTLDTIQLQNQQPHAMSASLRIAAGYGFQPGEPGLWAEGSGWLELGSPLTGCVDSSGPSPVVTDLGAAFDLSDDGAVAVGLLWESCSAGRAFRWTDADGSGEYTLLDQVGAPGFERATVVSADGKVAAGFAPLQGPDYLIDRSPARWNEDGTGSLLDPTNGTEPGEVKAISPDGHILAGDWAGATGGQTGFTWTAADGVQRFSTGSSTPELDSIFVNAMSANGKFILGTVSTFDPDTLNTTQSAYAWTTAGGVQPLDEIATSNGITLPTDTHLTNVMAVSADGTVVLGDAEIAAPPNDPLGFPTPKVFVLVLPASIIPQ